MHIPVSNFIDCMILINLKLIIIILILIDAVLEEDWQSMKTYLHTYIENHKSKIFDDTINEFKEQISISIEHLKEYIIGTVFTTLNENSESDYACFWEISKQPKLGLEVKDKFM